MVAEPMGLTGRTRMNRTPIYSKDRNHRIVSVPNGAWRLQHCTNLVEGKPKGTKTSDPWENISHAIEFDRAEALLKARNAA